MHQEPFQLFGFQHIFTLFVCFSLIVLLPVYFKGKSSEAKKMMSVSLSALILVHTFDSVLNTFTFNHAWQEALPLQMCDLSALCIAYYFISGEKMYFNCAYSPLPLTQGIMGERWGIMSNNSELIGNWE